MKKLLLLALLAISVTSCEKQPKLIRIVDNPITAYETGNSIKDTTDIGHAFEHKIYEIDYKGHIYLYTKVKSGICLTHAAHCECFRVVEYIKLRV